MLVIRGAFIRGGGIILWGAYIRGGLIFGILRYVACLLLSCSRFVCIHVGKSKPRVRMEKHRAWFV